MGIKTGSGKGSADRGGGKSGGRGQPIIRRGQAQKPFRPTENAFPEKKEFRLGYYQVVEERDDYLICKGYDPNAKDPFTEITPAAFRKIKVAKPQALQRTPWDGGTFDIGGVTYTYEYSDDEYGVRTATWTDDNGNEQEEEQRINIPYIVEDLADPGEVIVAVEIRKSAVVDGVDVEDEDGGRLSWMDLNVDGRRWEGPLATEDEDADLPDGTGGCECGECVDGVTMPASSTVCCTAHLTYEMVDPWDGTTRSLNWTTGNVWLTDEFDGPDCGGMSNVYRWRLTVSATTGSTLLELATLTDNGCTEECIVYATTEPWQCLCNNELTLKHWNNIDRGELSCRVCIKPGRTPTGTFSGPCSSSSACIGITELELPTAIALTVSGFEGSCLSNALSYAHGSGDSIIENTYCGTPSFPFWTGDINATSMLEVDDPPRFGFCASWSREEVVGTYKSGCYTDEPFTSTRYVGLRSPDGGDCTWTLAAGVLVPWFTAAGGDTCPQPGIPLTPCFGEWKYFSTSIDPADVDALIAWLNGSLTLNRTGNAVTCYGSGTGTFTTPDTVGVAFNAFTSAAESPSADGSCAGCTTPTVTDAAGACCIGTECLDVSQADCTTLSGTWYTSDANCEAACSTAGACCILFPTASQCYYLDGEPDCNALLAALSPYGAVSSDWTAGLDCDNVTCPTLGACCTDASTCADSVLESACSGAWREGKECGDIECGAITGACCCDGGCIDDVRWDWCGDDCDEYLECTNCPSFEPDTLCTEVSCATGACCWYNPVSFMCECTDFFNEAACVVLSGTWGGAGTTCAGCAGCDPADVPNCDTLSC